MKKGIGSFCNGDASTSTLNQQNVNSSFFFDSSTNEGDSSSPPTLEEMILQLELEEEIARKAKLRENDEIKRRMSCVNNSDILRSARNALNQYPRFSLDGKDAMYRSSFRNLAHVTAGRKSVCCSRGKEKTPFLPPVLAGERVVWCKPGVVAKLMGLEAMPMPIRGSESREKLGSLIRKQNLRRRSERHELERRRVAVDMNGCCSGGIRRGPSGYCVVKPIAVEAAAAAKGETGWPIRHFL